MKKSENFIVVADIGSFEITCMLGQPTENGKIKIVALATEPSVGVERGCVKDVDSASRCLKRCIVALEEQTSKKVEKIYVGYNARSLRVFVNTFTENFEQITLLTKETLDVLAKKNLSLPIDKEEDIISIIANKYILDDQEFKDAQSRSVKKVEASYLVTSSKRKWKNSLERVVSSAGYKLAGMFVNATCSAKSVLTEEEAQKGTAIVDFGAQTCSVAICEGGIIRHLAILPLGGNVLDNDLMQGCKVDRETALKLKEKRGGALIDLEHDHEVELTGKDGIKRCLLVKQIAYILEARLDEIIENVDYQIELAGYHNRLEGGIVITGGGAQLKNISQLFASRLRVPCRIGVPQTNLEWPEGMKPKPSFSAAAGLALLGECSASPEKVVQPPKQEEEPPVQPEGKTNRIRDGILRFFESKDSEGERM